MSREFPLVSSPAHALQSVSGRFRVAASQESPPGLLWALALCGDFALEGNRGRVIFIRRTPVCCRLVIDGWDMSGSFDGMTKMNKKMMLSHRRDFTLESRCF